MGALLIGWAEESIVPKKKAGLEGQFFERISEYVESEISATAMAVETDGDEMILVSVDVVQFTVGLLKMVREKFAKMTTEIDVKKIMVAATHTHNSLIMKEPSGKSGSTLSLAQEILNEFLPTDKEYKPKIELRDDVLSPEEAGEFVTDQIALAAYRAWENRKKSFYSNEFGRAAVGMCRRAHYDDGTSQMWGDTNTANFVAMEGGSDSGVELLYTFDENKSLTGVVANIACPAQILEQRSFISADYWGRTKQLLREHFGEHVYLLGLCGAAGDQCPRDLVRWVKPETPIDDPNVKRPYEVKRKADPSMYDISGCNKVGKRIAREIISVYEEIEDLKEEAIFEHRIQNVSLPLRKVTMTEYENAKKGLKNYIQEHCQKKELDYEDSARLHVYAGIIKRYREQQTTEVYPVECHMIRFGDIAIMTNPFELFLDYGNRMKARSLAEQTFIVQLCCGSAAYLPTEKAEKAGHYSAYVSSGHVGHVGGDILTRNTITEINKMFSTR